MIRKPVWSGMFYPGSREKLKKSVEEILSKAGKSLDKLPDIKSIIVPHAGYVYSGFTAAHAYAAVRERRYEAIVIVGPSHRAHFSSVSIHPGDAFRTPLGDLKINTELRKELLHDEKRIFASEKGHLNEHSIEVQLPFLQVIFEDPLIVPVVMGDQSKNSIQTLSERLEEVLMGRDVLLIASTDLSHYFDYDYALKLDREILQSVESFDPSGLLDKLESGSAEACGGGPMVTVLTAARQMGASCTNILHYCNSGDVTGDKSRVVGYLSAAIH